MGFWGGLVIGALAGAALLALLIFVLARWAFARYPDAIAQRDTPAAPAGDPSDDPQASEAAWLEPKHVPEELREVVPVARKFGVGCDGLRSEIVAAATAEERAELVTVMCRHFWVIQKWIDYTPGHAMPEWLVPIMYARTAAEELQAPLVEPFTKSRKTATRGNS